MGEDGMLTSGVAGDTVGAEQKAETCIAAEPEVADSCEAAEGLPHAVCLIGGALYALEKVKAVVVVMRPAIDAPEGGDGLLDRLDGRVGEHKLVDLERKGEAANVGAK